MAGADDEGLGRRRRCRSWRRPQRPRRRRRRAGGARGEHRAGHRARRGPATDRAESDGTLGLVVPAAAVGATTLAGPPGDTIRAPVHVDADVPRYPRPAPADLPGRRRNPGAAGGPDRSVRREWRRPDAVAHRWRHPRPGPSRRRDRHLPAPAVGDDRGHARAERIGPIPTTIVADTTATQPDPARGVVPAEEISIPVAVNDTFSATGKRVELTKATGTVRFENLDPTSTNRIAAGSIVRTASGVRFRTNATITVPRAELVGLTIFPARASVKVTAVDGGPDGNVERGRSRA